jgi:hypothetical protein
MYAKPTAKGRFKEMDDVSRSLSGSTDEGEDEREIWIR